MTLTRLSWYLCGLFLFALIATSAISYVPGRETMLRFEMGIWLALAGLFAVAALVFRHFDISGPKWLLRVFQCLAVLATLLVVIAIHRLSAGQRDNLHSTQPG